MIKGILFDFRGTLVDVGDAHKEAQLFLLDFLREKGKTIDDSAFMHLTDSCHTRITEKQGTSLDSFDWTTPFLRDVLLELTVSLSSAEFDNLRKEYDKRFVRATRLYPDARFMLNLIRRMGGIKMGIVIDGTSERERAIIRELLIEDFFDIIIISDEVGKNKLSSVPLQKAIAGLTLSPSEIVVVGDRMDKDIIPANKLGCVSVLLVRTGRFDESIKSEKPTHTITALDNLITLVQWGSND